MLKILIGELGRTTGIFFAWFKNFNGLNFIAKFFFQAKLEYFKTITLKILTGFPVVIVFHKFGPICGKPCGFFFYTYLKSNVLPYLLLFPPSTLLVYPNIVNYAFSHYILPE